MARQPFVVAALVSTVPLLRLLLGVLFHFGLRPGCLRGIQALIEDPVFVRWAECVVPLQSTHVRLLGASLLWLRMRSYHRAQAVLC